MMTSLTLDQIPKSPYDPYLLDLKENDLIDEIDLPFPVSEDINLDFDEFNDLLGNDLEIQKPKTYQSVNYLLGHLNSPIVNEEVDFLLKYEDMHCVRHKLIKKMIIEKEPKNYLREETCHKWKCLINYIQNDAEKIPTNKVKNTLYKFLNSSLENLECQGSYYHKKSIPTNQFRNWLIYDKLIPAYKNKIMSETIKDHISYIHIKRGSFLSYLNFEVDPDIVFFNCPSHGWQILPTNFLLCVLDMLQCEFSVRLLWVLSDLENKYQLSIYEAGDSLINTIEKIRNLMKEDDFFNVLAKWEPLIVGYVLNLSEPDDSQELYNICKQEILEVLQKYNLSISLLDDLTLNKLKRSPDYPKLILELTGLRKSFGHPTLNIAEGLASVRKVGCKPADIDQNIVDQALGQLKYMFLMNYRKRHKHYPPIDIPEDFPFKKQLDKNELIHGRIIDRQSILIWNQLNFNQVFVFDTSPNLIDLIKDTAIASPREFWFENFDHCAFKNLYGKSKPRLQSGEPKRGIVKFLESTGTELIQKLYERSHRYYNIKRDGLAVLCPKERELKTKGGRPYLKQTFWRRLDQTVLEKNISNGFMKYISEQSMTLNELEMQKKLLSLVGGQANDFEIINLDLSKWNLTFRLELVEKFGKFLDELYGTKYLFEDSHKFFEHSIVISNNRMCPPDIDPDNEPIPGKYCYKYHLGGFEGMNQKFWTLITIALIKLTARLEKLHVSVLGQGDNQVILIKYNQTQLKQRIKIRDHFISVLKSTFQGVNLELKTDETWHSRFLFEYGKQRYWKGHAISQSTKKIARLIADTNDGVASWNGSLNTISTITEGSARGDVTPDVSFIIYGFETLHFLNRRQIITQETDSLKLLFLLNYHSSLGGLNLSNYMNHFIRGYDDALNYWIGFILHTQKYYPSLYKYMIGHINTTPRKMKDYSKLVENIFVLNIRSITALEVQYREMSLNYLKEMPNLNPFIKKAIDSEGELSKENLINTLISMQPFFPALAHEIFKNSNQGLILSIIGRVSNIQTLNQIVQSVSNISFLEKMDIENKRFKENIKNILKNNYNYISKNEGFWNYFLSLSTCSTLLSKIIRYWHWELNMVGNTLPNPLCQIKLLQESNPEIRKQSIAVQCSNTIKQGNKIKFLHEPGPFRSYIGSETRQKLTKPSVIIDEKTDSIRSIMRLYHIYSWLKLLKANRLTTFVKTMIDDKLQDYPNLSNIPIEDWAGNIWGGSIIHRFRCEIERTAALINHLPTLGSHIQFSTDLMSYYRKGGEDWTIFFQLIELYSQSLIIHKVYHNEPHPNFSWAYFACLQGCTVKIEDFDFDIESEKFETYQLAEEYLNEPKISEIYDPEIVRIELSLLYGIVFSEEHQVYFYQTNQETLNLDLDLIDTNRFQLSQTEFRYVDFHYLIIGIFLTSHAMQVYLNTANSDCLPCPGLVSLATFLLNDNKVGVFLQFCRHPSSEHNTFRKIIAISNKVFHAILTKIRSNCHYYLTLLSQATILGISNHSYYKAANSLLTCLGEPNLKYDKDRSEIQSQIKTKLSLGSSQIILNPNSDTTILAWRRIMTAGKAQQYEYSTPNDPSMTRFVYQTDTPQADLSLIMNPFSNSELSGRVNLEIKDIHHIGRPLGNISSATSKIIPVFQLLKLEPKVIYCLAEGSGSIIHSLAHLYPKALLYFNTLTSPDVDLTDNVASLYPSSLMNDSCQLLSRLQYFEHLNLSDSDILSEEFKIKIRRRFSEHPPDILTIDAENKGNVTNLHFLSEYLPEWIYSTQNSPSPKIYVQKLFVSPALLMQIKELFGEQENPRYYWYLIKTWASHVNNKEFYLYVTNFKSDLLEALNIPQLIFENIYNNSQIDKLVTKDTSTKIYIDKLLNYGKFLLKCNREPCLIYPDTFWISFQTNSYQCSPLCKIKLTEYRCALRDIIKIYVQDTESLIFDSIKRKQGHMSYITGLIAEMTFFYGVHKALERAVPLSSLIVAFAIASNQCEIKHTLKFKSENDNKVISASILLEKGWFELWDKKKTMFRKLPFLVRCNCKYEVDKATTGLFKLVLELCDQFILHTHKLVS